MRFQPAGRDNLQRVCDSRAARQADTLESHTGEKEEQEEPGRNNEEEPKQFRMPAFDPKWPGSQPQLGLDPKKNCNFRPDRGHIDLSGNGGPWPGRYPGLSYSAQPRPGLVCIIRSCSEGLLPPGF